MKKRTEAPEGRVRSLLEAATRVFCTYGFERAQMSDVAKAMGVATGTVYLYVESKEALFDLVVRAHADAELLARLKLPVKTPKRGATLAFLRELFERPGQWPALEAALAQRKAADARTELLGILRELYGLMNSHRVGFTLLRRSVLEFPGLFEVFLEGLRKRLLVDLGRYIEARVAAGQLAPQKHAAVTAAVLLQSIAWATLQRPWDPGFKELDEAVLEETVLETLVRGVLP